MKCPSSSFLDEINMLSRWNWASRASCAATSPAVPVATVTLFVTPPPRHFGWLLDALTTKLLSSAQFGLSSLSSVCDRCEGKDEDVATVSLVLCNLYWIRDISLKGAR